MKFDIEKKTLIFFAGIVVIAAGITKVFPNEFISILAIFLGVYLMVKGLA